MKTRLAASALLALAVLCGAAPAAAQDKTLRLAVGDPARKGREAPVVLDAVTDTRTGDLLTPAQMAARLAGARLVLVGESHTDVDFHRAQLRVIQELRKAGRQVLIGLEMYPYPEQPFLDQWTRGLLTEQGFVELSRWYGNWGYHWDYYRDIFLYARDHGLPMFAVNAPRAVVTAVRQKGFDSLTPEEAAHVPRRVDTASDEHRALFRAYFGDDDPLHGGMSPEQLDGMFAAQATWDAAMAHNALKALGRHGGPNAVMVVLAGTGHVAYGLGIQRQALVQDPALQGKVATVVPVPVRDGDGHAVAAVQASYADFVWGLPPQAAPLYPSLGLSMASGEGEAGRKVIFVAEGSAAARAGFQVGDLLLAMDGAPLTDKESFHRALAAKRWGDAASFSVRRGDAALDLQAVFRRQATLSE
ncbi:MAG TPA: ChaN family lipoprotein [Thermoanaerobaculia bacterium]|nr:ChaN family lipoprotein [Thermoanaerobaculia bacterium]